MIASMALVAGCTAPETRTGREPTGDDGGTNDDGNQTGNNTGNPTGPTVGGNVTTPVGNTSAGAGTIHDVHMVDTAYQPDNLQVNATDTVRFSNLGVSGHTVTLIKDGGLIDHADHEVAPGDNVSVTFAEPGVYKLRCKYHSTDYDTAGQMIGRVTVV